MTQYGYRLYAVELHEGRKHSKHAFGRAELPVADSKDAKRVVDYRTAALADVGAALNRVYSFGLAKDTADDEGPVAARGMSMLFESAELVNDCVRLTLQHGLINSDGNLVDPVDPDAPPTSLKNKSTIHPYRATLVTRPEFQRALLVVETRGRACPIISVVRGLNSISVDGWRLQIVGHLAGEAAMLAYIRRANIKQVAFDKWVYEDDGPRGRREMSFAVRADLEGQLVRDKVIQWAKDYFGFQRDHTVDDEIQLANALDSDSVKELSAEERRELRQKQRAEVKAAKAKAKAIQRATKHERSAGAAAEMKQAVFTNRVEEVDVDFNAVSVELDDGSVQRTFTPTSDFRKFTYGLGYGLVSDTRFFTTAEATAVNLLTDVQDLQI